MKIGFDYDDVLVEHIPAVIKFHNDTYQTSLTQKDFHSYKFWEVWGGTKQQAIDKIHKHYNSQYFLDTEPVIGAQQIITNLSKNNSLEIITARQKEIEQQTHNCVQKHYPNQFDKIHIVNHYSNDNSKPLTKRDVCDENQIELLVEDSLDHAVTCVTSNRDIVLINKPWNQTTKKLHSGIHRVNSLEDFF